MKSCLPPLAVLVLLLAFSFWNSANVMAETDRWRSQIQQADALAQAGDWPEAVKTLSDSYDDWASRQTYLHIVSQHGAVDDAEAMYRRAQAYAAARELGEFRAELSDLRDQLGLLGDMERFSIQNVL